MSNVIGIDPGKTSGAVARFRDGVLIETSLLTFDEPWTLAALAVDEVALELVGGRYGQAGQFEFGRAFGRIEGAVMQPGVRIHYVSPQWWKARLVGAMATSDKELSFRAAARLFPHLDWNAKRGARGGLGGAGDQAEAALIGWTIIDPDLRAELLLGKRTVKRKTDPFSNWKKGP